MILVFGPFGHTFRPVQYSVQVIYMSTVSVSFPLSSPSLSLGLHIRMMEKKMETIIEDLGLRVSGTSVGEVKAVESTARDLAH